MRLCKLTHWEFSAESIFLVIVIAEAEENNKSCSIVWRYFENTLQNNKIYSMCKKLKMQNAFLLCV